MKPTPLGNYLFLPYGPYLKTKSALNSALKSLKTLAKSQNAFFVRLEPTLPFTPTEMAKFHLKKTHDINPAHTWTIDLSAPTEEILKNIEKNHTRHYRNAKKHGVTTRTSKNPAEISKLIAMQNSVASRSHHFGTHDQNYLQNQLEAPFATLYLAEHENSPIATALVYDSPTHRYDVHGGTVDSARNLYPGDILTIQRILDAKTAGQKIYDFWGITTSSDPNHPWAGFTRYKKSFGGNEVNYAGTWDFILNPFTYQIYSLLRPLNKLRQKIKRR